MNQWRKPWWQRPKENASFDRRFIAPFILRFSKIPVARLQIEYIGFYYELLSRDNGSYLLGRPFDKLESRTIWKLRDQISDIAMPGFNPVAAVVPYEEVKTYGASNRTASSWGEPVISDHWTGAYCFNLEHSDKEILKALKSKLPRLREEREIKNPASYQDKGPPWRLVLALQDKSPADDHRKAKLHVASWRSDHGHAFEGICASIFPSR
jgi:hypothetical protein